MNLSKLINQLLPATGNNEAPAANGLNVGSLATGAALGSVAGFLANSATGRQLGRKALRTGRSAAGLGGLALIGTLAYKAISSARDSQQAGSAAPLLPRPTENQQTPTTNPLLILRSMIAAAHADGQLDAEEQDRILGQMHDTGLTATERQLLMRELHNPVSIEELSMQCTNANDSACVYAAAVLAIVVDSAAEQAYLAHLSQALALPPELVASIEQQTCEA